MMDLEKRQALAAAKRQVRELMDPVREAQRIARAKARKDRTAKIGKPAEGQRQPRVREPLYLAWVRRLPCVACLCHGVVETRGIEAAHLRFSDAKLGRINSGMQAKPDDRWVTPLCHHHHQHDQHKRNEPRFWSDLGIEPGALCLDLHAAYLTGQDAPAIIRKHIAARRV
jgi:hypothetical protein